MITTREIIELVRNPNVSVRIHTNIDIYRDDGDGFKFVDLLTSGPTGPGHPKELSEHPEVQAHRLVLRTNNDKVHSILRTAWMEVNNLPKEAKIVVYNSGISGRLYGKSTFEFTPTMVVTSKDPIKRMKRKSLKPEFEETFKKYETEKRKKHDYIRTVLDDLKENHGFNSPGFFSWKVDYKESPDEWYICEEYLDMHDIHITIVYTEGTLLWSIIEELNKTWPEIKKVYHRKIVQD